MVPPPSTTARVALGAPSHCPCSMFSSPLFSFDLKSYVSHDAMAHSCLMCGHPVNKNQDFNSSKRLSLRHKVVRLIPSRPAASSRLPPHSFSTSRTSASRSEEHNV